MRDHEAMCPDSVHMSLVGGVHKIRKIVLLTRCGGVLLKRVPMLSGDIVLPSWSMGFHPVGS